ncbi:MAG: hypothetical protein HY824_04635 [Acidobacteria bacterium]|nr:hypothetical protein [Acidobacteriota bacterium]
MDTRRLAAGTLVGGITIWVLGYVIFDVTFADFYAANVGSATGVGRDAQLMWAVVLGSLSYGALIAYAMGNRTATPTVGGGAAVGAVVAFLVWFTVDFILYGVSNVSNLARTIVDPVLELVRGGVAGAAIAVVAGKMSSAARM